MWNGFNPCFHLQKGKFVYHNWERNKHYDVETILFNYWDTSNIKDNPTTIPLSSTFNVTHLKKKQLSIMTDPPIFWELIGE